MSKAYTPAGNAPSDEDDTEGLEHVPIRRQEDGSYHVGERAGPLGTGPTEARAFFDYATNMRAAAEGANVPISGMAYHGTLQRPVNYIFLDTEQLPDGAWHMTEIGGNITGYGDSKAEARIHLAQLAVDISTEVMADER